MQSSGYSSFGALVKQLGVDLPAAEGVNVYVDTSRSVEDTFDIRLCIQFVATGCISGGAIDMARDNPAAMVALVDRVLQDTREELLRGIESYVERAHIERE